MTTPNITDNGWVLNAPRPDNLADEVMPGLWLGGSWATYTDTFEAVHDRSGGADGPFMPPDLAPAVQRVLADLRAGRKTLVFCYKGLNRSGLVAAEVLWRLKYKPTGDAVLEHLRAVRSEHVLCNPRFEQHVRRLP